MSENLNQRYKLTQKLGSGASGLTFLADDLVTKKTVVVKRLRNELTDETKEIWPREVQLLRNLDNPNIPKFIDFFEQKVEFETLPHIVQEYIAGQNIQEELKEKHYTPIEVLEFVISVLKVLCYLQSLSPPILHRDLKPGNIIRQKDTNRLYLIDFGTATSAKGQTFGHTMVAGTLGYQSLEQIEGDPGLSSDIYSLGVIAVQLLSSRPIEELYVGMGRIRWREALPHAPQFLLHFLEQMLAENAESRFPNANIALTAAEHCFTQMKEFPEAEKQQYFHTKGQLPNPSNPANPQQKTNKQKGKANRLGILPTLIWLVLVCVLCVPIVQSYSTIHGHVPTMGNECAIYCAGLTFFVAILFLNRGHEKLGFITSCAVGLLLFCKPIFAPIYQRALLSYDMEPMPFNTETHMGFVFPGLIVLAIPLIKITFSTKSRNRQAKI